MTVSDSAPVLATAARRVLILANPCAGARDCRRLVDELAQVLTTDRLAPAVCWQRDEFSARLAEVGPDELRCVVAAGGDGTLAEVLNRAPGQPTAVLPLGTENLLARHLGLERSGRRVAELIAAGQVRCFDLAAANGRLFTLMASAGFDAEVVRRTAGRRRGHVRRLSYAWPIWQAVRDYRFPQMEVEIVETGERLGGALIFVFNMPCYALGLPLGRRACPDDGLLDVCVFPKAGLGSLLRSLSHVVAGRPERLPGFIHRRVRGVRLSSAQPVPVQTDGDPAGVLPLAVEVRPLALRLIVPATG